MKFDFYFILALFCIVSIARSIYTRDITAALGWFAAAGLLYRMHKKDK
ncbi:MAG: hypothetical protein WCR72_18030 [Bacteroidota bacterium]